MVQKRRKRKHSLLLRVSVICFVSYVAISLINMQLDVSAKRRELDELKVACEQQRLQNKEVERTLSLGDDQEYIERIAREKLGFAYPDERIFIDISGK